MKPRVSRFLMVFPGVCVLPASSAAWHREDLKKERKKNKFARLVWHASVESSDLVLT